MAKIVTREKLERGASVFFVVTDEDGRVGTVHLEESLQGSRLISRDHHVPIDLPGYEWGTVMHCHFVGGMSKCDGSSLFGYESGTAFLSDEQAYRIAASMINAELDESATSPS